MKRLWRKVDLWYCQQSPEQINGLSIRREKYQKFLVGRIAIKYKGAKSV